MPTKPARGVKPTPHPSAPLCTVLLILALPEEQQYLYEVMESRPGWDAGLKLRINDCTYDSPDGPVRVIVSVLDGMGPVEAALGTASAITTYSPDLVIMVGLAGALDHDKVGLGDVVISNSAKLYTVDKVGSAGQVGHKYRFSAPADAGRARPSNEVWVDPRDRFMDHSFMRYLRDVVRCSTADQVLASVTKKLLSCPLGQLEPSWIPERFKNTKPFQRGRLVQAGCILGSTHVVDSGEYRAYLLEKNDKTDQDIYHQVGSSRNTWEKGPLLAVDMESYALLRAVNDAMGRPSSMGGCDTLVGGLLVRGISDMCEEKSDLDKTTGEDVRRLAVANATLVGLTLIESLDYPALLKR